MLDFLAGTFLGYGTFFLTTALAYAIICLGLNVQWGQTGLFNVGVAGFVAVGAYASAILTTPATTAHLGGYGLPIALGWAGAMVAAGAASLLVGWITLRLRADYLAITTFGIAVTINLIALNAQSLTGGPFGIGFIPRPFGALAEKPFLFNTVNLLLVAGVVLLLYLALERLARSPWGRVLRAIREDEKAAISLGKSSKGYRLQAFALGGAIMGLGGAVQAHFTGFISPDNYLPNLTFQVWTMLIIGGSGNNRGAILGGVLIWAIWSASGMAIGTFFPPEDQARAASLQIVGIGVLLSAFLLARPRGLFGEKRRYRGTSMGLEEPKTLFDPPQMPRNRQRVRKYGDSQTKRGARRRPCHRDPSVCVKSGVPEALLTGLDMLPCVPPRVEWLSVLSDCECEECEPVFSRLC